MVWESENIFDGVFKNREELEALGPQEYDLYPLYGRSFCQNCFSYDTEDTLLEEFIKTHFLNYSRLRVVDLGGGCGRHWRIIRDALPNVELDYTIVESTQFLENIESMDVPLNVTYVNTVDAIQGEIDLFYSNSGLQYVYNPPEKFHKIFHLQPKFVVLHRIPTTTQQDTFLTRQMYEGYRIPYWVVNFHKKVEFAKEQGYTLEYEELIRIFHETNEMKQVEVRNFWLKRNV